MKTLTTLLLFISLSVTAQVPTAKEARKQAAEWRVKDSLLTLKLEQELVRFAIQGAIEEGKDSVIVWNMNTGIQKELLSNGYKIKPSEYLFKHWYIYW